MLAFSASSNRPSRVLLSLSKLDAGVESILLPNLALVCIGRASDRMEDVVGRRNQVAATRSDITSHIGLSLERCLETCHVVSRELPRPRSTSNIGSNSTPFEQILDKNHLNKFIFNRIATDGRYCAEIIGALNEQ